MKRPYFSICIPSYNRVSSTKRLLESIKNQTFKDIEIIITDDSDNDALTHLLNEIDLKAPVIYQKNIPACGSPLNWNKAISLARGEWIKIMHDDDWFSDENSLTEFYYTSKNCKNDFIYSGYNEIDESKGKLNHYIISPLEEIMLRFSPLCLFKKNFIGHPSTTLIKNNRTEWFDTQIKWVVDFEFYIRALKKKPGFTAIKTPLINIGISKSQITKQVFRKKEIEIPENIYLIKKIGINSLKNIFVTDYYWRLFRNLKIESVESLGSYLPDEKIPGQICSIITTQKKIGLDRIIKNKYLSKIMMLYYYIRYVIIKNNSL